MVDKLVIYMPVCRAAEGPPLAKMINVPCVLIAGAEGAFTGQERVYERILLTRSGLCDKDNTQTFHYHTVRHAHRYYQSN